ncbi:MAG: ABC transporter substrate-binding protein [Janthinobacterium lividum]
MALTSTIAGLVVGVVGISSTRGASPDDVARLHRLLPPEIQAAGVLKIATDAHHPPCESFGDDNATMIGFEPDLWAGLGKRLGVSIQTVSINFDGLIPAVQSGRYDVAMECITDSAEREHQVTFVDYAYASAATAYSLADRSEVSPDPASLCGLHAATQVGMDFNTGLKTLSDACVAHGKPGIEISQFSTDDAALMALYSGRVDFVLDDGAAASELQKHAPRPIRTVDVGLPKLIAGAIVKPGNDRLANALQAAFQSMIDDGSYGRIMQNWHLTGLSLPQAGIDLAIRSRLGSR